MFAYTVKKMKQDKVGVYTLDRSICVMDIAPNFENVKKETNSKVNVDKHVHGFYSVIWLEKGGFCFHIGKQQYLVPDKSLIVIPPSDSFDIESISRMCGMLCFFSEDYFQSIEAQWESYFKASVLSGIHVLAITDSEDETRIADSMSLLQDSYTANTTAVCSVASATSALTLLLCSIANAKAYVVAKQEKLSIESSNDNLYLRFLELIETNYRHHHFVKFYAAELGVSGNVLNACCKASSGKKPLAIIEARIVQEAKRMLLCTKLRSSEISYELGFREQSHFVNFFKRFVKVTPTAFREKTGRKDLSC